MLAPATGAKPRPTAAIATVRERTLALTQNLGGYPGEMVSFVGIFGTEVG